MSNINKVLLSTKNVAESARDLIIKNVISAKRELNLDESALRRLVTIIAAASDEQVFRSLASHESEVKHCIDEIVAKSQASSKKK